MLVYILKRSLIALNQKKKMFIVPGILLVLFILYCLIGSSFYKIESLVIFNKNIPAGSVDGISKRKIWNDIMSWIGGHPAFVVRNVDSLPENIKVALSEDTYQDDEVVRSRRQMALQVRNVVKKLINIKGDGDNLTFTITYYGSSRSLGIKLVNFYAGKLIDRLKQGAGDVIRSLEQSREKVNTERRSNFQQKITDVGKKLVLNHTLLEYISSGSHSAPTVISRSSPQSKGALARILSAALILFSLTALVFIIQEFMSKTLVTEVQIARYLQMPVIGSLPKIGSLSNSK